MVRLISMHGLSCLGDSPWFFCAFGEITGCGSASLKLCVCYAASPWSQSTFSVAYICSKWGAKQNSQPKTIIYFDILTNKQCGPIYSSFVGLRSSAADLLALRAKIGLILQGGGTTSVTSGEWKSMCLILDILEWFQWDLSKLFNYSVSLGRAPACSPGTNDYKALQHHFEEKIGNFLCCLAEQRRTSQQFFCAGWEEQLQWQTYTQIGPLTTTEAFDSKHWVIL